MKTNQYADSSQKGVTFYFASSDKTTCIDIDVEPGIDTIIFSQASDCWISRRYLLRGVKKQFPDVTTIVIEDKTYEITIDNMMFPNVKKVEAQNAPNRAGCFLSGNCLIKQSYAINKTKVLLNTFCKAPDEIIDLSGVSEIAPYAFEGCRSDNIIHMDDIVVCGAKAFDGYLASSYDNGMLTAGNILLSIDDTESVTIPKKITNAQQHLLAPDSKLNEITFESFKQIDLFRNCGFPEVDVVNINDTSFISLEDARNLLNFAACRYFNITKDNQLFCSVNGVVYTKDKKMLIKYPIYKEGPFEIPDGTEIIEENAFAFSDITSIKIPDSVYRIKTMAFFQCKKLKHVSLNNTMTDYAKYNDTMVFNMCSSLKEIDIPFCVKVVGKGMLFNACSNVTIHEGIEVIKENALTICQGDAAELVIPTSLKHIGSMNLSKDITAVRVKGRTPTGLINDIVNVIPYAQNTALSPDIPYIFKLTVEENGKDYVFYIPKHIPAETAEVLDSFFSNFSPAAMDMEYIESLYEKCPSYPIKYDTALALYKATGKEQYKELLKKNRNSIIKRYVKDKCESALIDFVKLGVCSHAALSKLAEEATKNEMSVLAAYILEAQDRKRPKEVNFRI